MLSSSLPRSAHYHGRNSYPVRPSCYHPGQRRSSSSGTVTAAAGTGHASGGKKTSDDDKKKKKTSDDDDSNLFLDNLGKIFLAAIAAVIAALVRGSRGTAARLAVREELQEASLLDPCEIDDLRTANSEFGPDEFRAVVRQVYASCGGRSAVTYEEFLSVTKRTLQSLHKGGNDGYTLEFGHLLDRVMIGRLEQRTQPQQKASIDSAATTETTTIASSSSEEADRFPLPLLFTVLSLALNSSVDDRIKLLFGTLQHHQQQQQRQDGVLLLELDDDDTNNGNNNDDHRDATQGGTDDPGGGVSEEAVADMVGHLQRTYQLALDPQILPTTVKYPVQEYAVGTPAELVARAKQALAEERTGDKHAVWSSSSEETETQHLSCRDFDDILRTMFVCAWGECYGRKTKKRTP